MRRFALLAVAILAAIVPQTGTACPSVFALRLSDYDPSLRDENSRDLGVLRFDPIVARYLIDKGHMKPNGPLLERVPLIPKDEHAAQAVARFMLGQDRGLRSAKLLDTTMWFETGEDKVAFKSASPFKIKAIGRLQRAAIIQRDCDSFSIDSLTSKQDVSEHYALIEFHCQADGVKTMIMAAVALKNSVPLRVYNGSFVPVCLPQLSGASDAADKEAH